MITTIAKEPLLHFAVLGALLFVLFGIERGNVVENENRIVISSADIDRHIALFERKWQRLPSQQELAGLLESDIREEILYREAVALGLDQDDAIVRRRMAQKMEFISADITDMLQPSEGDLQHYLQRNAAAFELPAMFSFEQIYLNPQQRGAALEADAAKLLDALQNNKAATETVAGDPILLPRRAEDMDTREITRNLGSGFSQGLLQAPIGKWHGPISSAFGLHLVKVSAVRPPRMPSLTEVRDAVEREWRQAQRQQAEGDFYDALRQKYEVVIAPIAESAAAVTETPDG